MTKCAIKDLLKSAEFLTDDEYENIGRYLSDFENVYIGYHVEQVPNSARYLFSKNKWDFYEDIIGFENVYIIVTE